MTDRRAVQVRPPKRVVVEVRPASERKVVRVQTGVPGPPGSFGDGDFLDGGPP